MSKRAFDLVVSSIALVLVAPLMFVIGLAVRLDSKGPALYRGVRTGLHGTPFRIYKFRTMVVGAESIGGPTTALGDTRVTRVGRVLRRFKLDELPQLLNILSGEMSLVGPRPEVPEVTALYEGEERLILTVRPGITDFASVEFAKLDRVVGPDDPYEVYRSEVLPVKNQLRIRYVKERSMLVDLKLLGRTLVAILRD